MSSWLIVYARRTANLLRCEEFSDSREALRERFVVEGANRDNPDLEVVVLGADSLSTIKVTHGRYFSGTCTSERGDR